MGAEPYYYIVPYQPDISAALQALRQREFEAGRYSPAPGRQHASIAEALEAAEADGTRSILDIEALSDTPGIGVAVRLPDRTLSRVYGTTRPTRAHIDAAMDFLDEIDRGCAVYLVLYERDAPSEILFAGYSFD